MSNEVNPKQEEMIREAAAEAWKYLVGLIDEHCRHTAMSLEQQGNLQGAIAIVKYIIETVSIKVEA